MDEWADVPQVDAPTERGWYLARVAVTRDAPFEVVFWSPEWGAYRCSHFVRKWIPCDTGFHLRYLKDWRGPLRLPESHALT